MKEDELTPTERKAFDALPRERIASRDLEDRTVRTLQKRDLLRARGRPTRTLSLKWTAVAAALVAAVIGGFALGQYTESRRTAEVMLAIHERGSLQLAADVQRAGTEYIRALAALSESSGQRDPAAHEQGRQAAAAALYAAAELVATLTPDDPLATNIVRVSEKTTRDHSAAGTEGAERKIVWF